ncbi:hypothetical protein CHISP_1268 [Chitinispirillum alkaliphilum]|nr:hypothetical protein CHISP_1268 [Chitinispirillum alkaliphilum]
MHSKENIRLSFSLLFLWNTKHATAVHKTEENKDNKAKTLTIFEAYTFTF